MKLLVILFALVAYVNCSDANKHCYAQVTAECSATGSSNDDLSCNAKYGTAFPISGGNHVHKVLHSLQKYANSHITHSFDYLLKSAHFGNYQKNREGFEKLFRELSDSTWDDAIDLIKYIGKRGGEMNFNARKDSNVASNVVEIDELGSLAHALDVQKSLALEAFNIHREASGHAGGDEPRHIAYDPEVTSFLEEHFVHKQADSIRSLSGHTNDLKRMLNNAATSRLSLFIFDEYLQKL